MSYGVYFVSIWEKFDRVEMGKHWFMYNGLAPVRRQAITWTNAGLLSIRPLGTNFSEIRIKTALHFISVDSTFFNDPDKWLVPSVYYTVVQVCMP